MTLETTTINEQTPAATPLEVAAVRAAPIVGSTAGVEALDSYNYVNADWIHELPAADHLSSMAGSYGIGVVGGAITEQLASRFASMGRHGSAEQVRRIGNAVTMLGSFACQVAIETATRGANDKWDMVASTAATVPGIIAGRGYAKISKRSQQPHDQALG